MTPSNGPAEPLGTPLCTPLTTPLTTCVPAMLRERADRQRDDTAFTFVDYERDWNGIAQSLTWSQVYRRALSVAQALGVRGSTGDRAVIMAPHGLDYIAAFLGAMHAGLIPIPLSVPLGRTDHERVASVLRDTAPAVILTTSSVVGSVAKYALPQPGESAPLIVYVDWLNVDWRKELCAGRESWPGTAYMQYTSGATRQPARVIVSHKNLLANFQQVVSDLFDERGMVAPADTTIVSWLPFYHDMGLMLGICAPVLGGFQAVLMSPTAFLQRPARWMQLMAKNHHVWSAAPDFGFELAASQTTSQDMAGLQLRGVQGILNGGERIPPATLTRFTDRFACYKLSDTVIRPSYGLAEATAYVTTRRPAGPPQIVGFDAEKLAAGYARRCRNEGGIELVSYGVPRSPKVRIVDPETRMECPAATTGEIWVHGANVAVGYWGRPQETQQTFGARLLVPSAGTPDGPWLRTGDLGFFSEGELFILGRLKDLLVLGGRNYYPDDIEATIQGVTGGRAVAIAAPDRRADKLVAIIELKRGRESDAVDGLRALQSDVAAAIFETHGLSVADVVVVAPGSIPVTTSGKVRRSAYVERYRRDRFKWLDAPACRAN
jgi:long-chain fatty acid adenylyltransferase FadD28